MNFRSLLGFNLGFQELHILQPDLDAWIRAQKASVSDCPDMSLWGAHPIRDFKADLADVVNMKWDAETMLRMGLRYDDLVQLGMTQETMILFSHLTLMGWASIGFRREHCATVSANLLYRIFGMSKVDIMSCLK